MLPLIPQEKINFFTRKPTKLTSFLPNSIINLQLCDNTYPKFFYRIKELKKYQNYPSVPNQIRENINFDLNNAINIVDGHINNERVWLAYSRPASYIDYNENFKIVDVCVVHKQYNMALESLKEQMDLSIARKEIHHRWVHDELLPIFMKKAWILGVKGRGDLYDKNRICGPCSNTDLMLFVVAFSQDIYIERVIIDLCAEFRNKYSICIIHYMISKHGFLGKSKDVVKGDKNSTNLCLDIFSLPEFKANFNRWNNIDPYYIRAFNMDSILFDRNNELRNLMKSVRCNVSQ